MEHLKPTIHTVDITANHIKRCKIVTHKYAKMFKYHISDSVNFLMMLEPKSVDLLYVDTGDMTPIEPTAKLQLREVEIIAKKNILKDDGLILIDDVKNNTPIKYGETSGLGKSKYAIPYLLENGYKTVFDGYQVAFMRS